jgi:hypothetical protein
MTPEVQTYSPTKNYPSFSSQINQLVTVTTLTTAGALTYTAAQVLGGLILRDPNGGARSDIFPSASSLLNAIEGGGGYGAGASIKVTIRNDADAAETITMTAGTGVTISGTATIAQSAIKQFLIVFTSVDPSSPAYTAYSLGTSVF